MVQAVLRTSQCLEAEPQSVAVAAGMDDNAKPETVQNYRMALDSFSGCVPSERADDTSGSAGFASISACESGPHGAPPS